MASALLQFVLLAAIIVAAGTVLTRCADGIAEVTGWGRLLIGSVLLAGATSLPELTVDLTAIRLGLPDLAVGDLLGSSLMNLLILAVLDLSHHSRGKMLSRAAAAHALSGTLSTALTATVGVGILVSGRAPQLVFLGAHASTWVLALGYLLGLRMVFLDQRVAMRQAVDSGVPAGQLHPRNGLAKFVAGFVAAAVVILFVGPRMAEVAGTIAEISGLGNSFVGTTFVAFSTSLPELVASLAALRIGAFDLAVGNVFGSNAFNMLLFLPLDIAFPGVLLAHVNASHVISVLTVVLATSVVIMGQLYQQESRRRFLEPDALLVIALIGFALFLIYATS